MASGARRQTDPRIQGGHSRRSRLQPPGSVPASGQCITRASTFASSGAAAILRWGNHRDRRVNPRSMASAALNWLSTASEPQPVKRTLPHARVALRLDDASGTGSPLSPSPGLLCYRIVRVMAGIASTAERWASLPCWIATSPSAGVATPITRRCSHSSSWSGGIGGLAWHRPATAASF